MSGLLLDTHILLWWLAENPKLPLWIRQFRRVDQRRASTSTPADTGAVAVDAARPAPEVF